MARDQEIVKQLQGRLRNWDPNGQCEVHSFSKSKSCEYDKQGRLINLHLCKLKLSQVPSEVWQFLALRELFLNDNQLSTLPAEVYNLTSLQTLFLSDNQLSTLPAEIGNLTSLQRLYLHRNQFSALPAEVGNLTALQELDLSDNQLSTLPAEVGNLTSLQTLELYCNQLNTLPAEVGNLTSLQMLSLWRNELSTLPAEVCNLTALQELDLNINQFSTLPQAGCNLSSLRRLSLSNNQLNTLPAEMGNLTALQELDLSDNPLQTPPPEIIAQDLPSILAYLRAQSAIVAEATGSVFSNEPIQPPSATAKAPAVPTCPIAIFYCYAHEDKDLRDRLDSHLSVLKRLGHIAGWYDREIQAGTEWERKIEAHLSTASIILLLVSSDFLKSDYCYGVEMQKALEMHEKGEARVLPILLRPVDWLGAPFAKLQILPTGAKPITRWIDQDEALLDVANQIRAVVTTLRAH